MSFFCVYGKIRAYNIKEDQLTCGRLGTGVLKNGFFLVLVQKRRRGAPLTKTYFPKFYISMRCTS